MQVTLLTTGSRGDVQPFLALAVGLKQAGHTVVLAAPPRFERMITNYGVCFSSLGKRDGALEISRKTNANAASGPTTGFLLSRVRAKMKVFAEVNREAWRACQGADAIFSRISPFLDAYSLAQKRSLPYFEVGLDPQTQTRAFPQMDLSHSPEIGGLYNWLTYLLVEQISWQIFRRSIQAFRVDHLGLEPYPFEGPGRLKQKNKVPIFYAFSPSVVPKPEDWPTHAHITGYWFLHSLENWRPSQDLMDFTASKPAPIYVGFGSMMDQETDAVLQIVIQALKLSNQRAVIAMDGKSKGSHGASLPGQCYLADAIPHDWLFPRMEAAVHHGGAGTTAASIRAGIPSVIVPHNYDQPFWGKQVARLGIGPKPIPRKRLTAHKLAAAIDQAVSDPEIRHKAADFGAKLRSENGVAQAVELFHQYIS